MLEVSIMITNLIASLATVGGMGFMNFLVTDQLGFTDIRNDKKTEVIAYSLLWSIFDYAIYLAVLSSLHNLKIHGNLSITAIIVWLLAKRKGLTSFLDRLL